jgi:predicted RNA-binding protein (virulence factor B family)
MQLGLINTLTIDRFTPPGAFLKDKQGNEVLLPGKYLLDEFKLEQEIDVFVFKDSEQRIVSTTETPFLLLEEFQYLRVTQITPIGAFVDWGLDKNLLVPFSEQILKLEEEESYLIGLKYDQMTDRLYGSMKIKNLLEPCTEDLTGEKVNLLICEKNDLGVSVIVNKKHEGLIFKNNIISDINHGDEIDGFVEKVREDGKLDIRLEPISVEKYDIAIEKILERLNQEGKLFLTDKSSPESINKELGMSKKTFKQSIGKLYKWRKIQLQKDHIELLPKS